MTMEIIGAFAIYDSGNSRIMTGLAPATARRQYAAWLTWRDVADCGLLYAPDAAKLEIIRHRFSTTQGEVELIYGGERLGQFGDRILLRPDGSYGGATDAEILDWIPNIQVKRRQEKRRAA